MKTWKRRREGTADNFGEDMKRRREGTADNFR